MVSSITLGNFKNIGGRNVLTGAGGSGLDTESLINAMVDARSLGKVKIEDKVELNDKRLEAFGTLSTLLETFRDASNALRNVPGFGKEADNAFMYRNATVTSNTSVAGSTYLSLEAEPGAATQTLNVTEITSLARAKKQTTGSFAVASADVSVVTAAHTAGFFKAGTVTINGEDLTLTAGDSLAQVAAKFNAVSDDTGISASVVKVGTNDFRLVFTATETGTDADFSLNPPSDAVLADADGVLSMISRTNLLTNGTFAADITSWTNASLGTGAISYSSGKMVLDGDGSGGNEAFARQAMTTVIGQTYTVRATLDDLTSSAFIRIGTDSDVSNVNNYDVANHEVAADGTVSFTFTATSTTTYLTVNSEANTTPFTLDDISVVYNATTAVTDTQTASDAVFVMDGLTFTRSTNAITDVVDGLTFTLNQTTPVATTLAIDISPDEDIARSSVINFINAYNELRVFSAQQNETDETTGQFVEDAVLATDSVFRNLMSTVSNELNAVVSGVSTNYDSLSKIGITFTDLPESDDQPFTRNILTIDESKFSTEISSHFDDVEALFGFSYTSNNANFRIFTRTNELSTSSFTLNLNPGASTFTATVGATTYTLSKTALSGGGYTLTAPEDSPLAGLSMIYASEDTATISVTTTQGIADRLYNAVENALESTTGTLAQQTQTIKDANTRAQTEITRANRQIELYRESLINQFAALESLLSSVNSILQSIDTQNQARFSS